MVELKEIIVPATSTLGDLIAAIDRCGSGIALVVDEDRKFFGLMTDGDVRRTILKGTNLSTCVKDVMNTNATTVTEGASEESIRNLISHAIRHIPVLDRDGRVVDLAVSPISTVGNGEAGKISLLSKKPASESRIIKKVLLVGGGGYIGSIIARKLLAKGYSVKIFDKFLYGKKSVAGIETDQKLEIEEGDTKNIQDVVRVMHDIDAVIHLAEIVGDPACAHDPLLTQETNLFATANLAMICRHLKILKVIYASSCSVYGATTDPDAILTEESPLNPVSLYARMKIEAENVLLSMKDKSFQPTILRLGTVFGASPRMRFDLVVNTLAMKAVTQKRITIFGGDQWRPFVHVDDVADAFILMMESPLEAVGGRIFNVGSNGMNFKINDIGAIIKRRFPDVDVEIQDKGHDRRDYRVDFSRIAGVGFCAKKGILDGIDEIESLIVSGSVPDPNDRQYSNIEMAKTL